ncbi:hypothetical protein [Okeania sp.]|uniref:hypothetical protein n=1 Tax=Okeania sp. TaxID=3100323 RepID=UPI002B4AB5C9|nr:hypothetical protein [Okeania sp.]MEB3341564.1 hypothetical protein [Okeania sp.]
MYDSEEKWVDGSFKPSTIAESISTFLEPDVYYVNIWSPDDGKDTDYKLSLKLTLGKD